MSAITLTHLLYHINHYNRKKLENQEISDDRPMIKFGIVTALIPLLDCLAIFLYLQPDLLFRYLSEVVQCYRVILIIVLFHQIRYLLVTESPKIKMAPVRSILSKSKSFDKGRHDPAQPISGLSIQFDVAMPPGRVSIGANSRMSVKSLEAERRSIYSVHGTHGADGGVEINKASNN
jgi:hypothetical protein